MARTRSGARAAALRGDQGYNPSTGQMERISPYEVTVGGSQHRRATPRIIGEHNVADYKRKMGICMTSGCNKVSGHSGEHS